MKVIETSIKNLVWIDDNGKKLLATKNLTPGITYYKEEVRKINGVEYRIWSPYKSKLSAAILNGLKVSVLKDIKKVLYLGTSTGTTSSHISDIIAEEGIIYGVEVASRVMLEFVNRVVENRRNVIPLFFDARYPELYADIIDKPVDMVYCDVAQPDQTRIAIINSKYFLKKNGILLYAIKARSIDAVRPVKEIYNEEVKKMKEEGFKIEQVIDLEPYEKEHAMIYARLL